MKHGWLMVVGVALAVVPGLGGMLAAADPDEPAERSAGAEPAALEAPETPETPGAPGAPGAPDAPEAAEREAPLPITPPVAEPPAPAPWPERPVWLLAQIEYLNKYYFRGFVQERDGVIVQPTFKAGIDLFRADEGLQRVSAVFGMRNSLHSEKTFAQASPEIWYEADIVAGLNFQLFDRVEVETLYVAITSPNGAFPTIQEFDLNLAFDDRGLWDGDFALLPRATFAFEFDNSAAGGPSGILMQLGIEPGFGLIQSPDFPLRISFPVTAGFSLNDYYILPFPGEDSDDTFGYVRAGLSLTAPLTFLPPDYGQWAITGGFDVIHLGGNMERFNRGRSTDVIGRVSLGMRF